MQLLPFLLANLAGTVRTGLLAVPSVRQVPSAQDKRTRLCSATKVWYRHQMDLRLAYLARKGKQLIRLLWQNGKLEELKRAEPSLQAVDPCM